MQLKYLASGLFRGVVGDTIYRVMGENRLPHDDRIRNMFFNRMPQQREIIAFLPNQDHGEVFPRTLPAETIEIDTDSEDEISPSNETEQSSEEERKGVSIDGQTATRENQLEEINDETPTRKGGFESRDSLSNGESEQSSNEDCPYALCDGQNNLETPGITHPSEKMNMKISNCKFCSLTSNDENALNPRRVFNELDQDIFVKLNSDQEERINIITSDQLDMEGKTSMEPPNWTLGDLRFQYTQTVKKNKEMKKGTDLGNLRRTDKKTSRPPWKP